MMRISGSDNFNLWGSGQEEQNEVQSYLGLK